MKHVVAVEIETENGNKRLKMDPMEGSREGSNNKLKIVLYEIAHSDNPQRGAYSGPKTLSPQAHSRSSKISISEKQNLFLLKGPPNISPWHRKTFIT